MVVGGGRVYWNATMEVEAQDERDNGMLVHYTRRSWEDYVAKMKMGGASVMTAGRPPRMAEVDVVDEEYMREEKVVFMGFRERWREIMKMEDFGKVVLTWVKKGRRCRVDVCRSCWWATVGDVDCFVEEKGARNDI